MASGREFDLGWEALFDSENEGGELPESEVDELLFQASQHFEETDSSTEAVTETDCPEPTLQPSSRRFGPPRSSEDVQLVKFNRIPKKTRANMSWSTNLWREWVWNLQKRYCGRKVC